MNEVLTFEGVFFPLTVCYFDHLDVRLLLQIIDETDLDSVRVLLS